MDPMDTEEAICNTQPDNEDDFNHGIITLACLSQHNQISEIFLSGSINTNTIKQATGMLIIANKDICLLLQQCLVKSVVKLYNEKII